MDQLKARIVDGEAVDVYPAEGLEDRFAPDVVAEFVNVPAGVVKGSRLAGKNWTDPPPIPQPPIVDDSGFVVSQAVFDGLSPEAQAEVMRLMGG